MAEEKKSAEQDPQESRLKYALESDEIPKIYANGFANFLNNADIGIILQLNNRPKAVINMSYTLAKTLHKKLGTMIDNFEQASKHEIMTTDFISQTIEGKGKKES